MDKEIIDSIYHLFRSRMVTTIIALILIIVVIIVVVGVVKFKIVKSLLHQVLLIVGVAVCSIGLLILQFFYLRPIYKDYVEQSYVLFDNAKLVLKTESSGTIDRENQVIVTDSEGTQYEFKIESDYSLEMGIEYIGTIAYTKHSNYVVWYCWD